MPAFLELTRLLVLTFALTTAVRGQGGQGDAQLEGTWTTKSRKVITGPGFYDPINERMFEPDLTGISYSFTQDGYYEEAYYRAVGNPTQPSCPQGIIQWQHGTYNKNANGSLSLFPFAVDGRQLLSDPCSFKTSLYTRYHQFELFKKYEVVTDGYSKAQRLNLYKFDGSPMNPMYLAYKPPQMLPTQTLNPTSSATAAAASSTGKSKRELHTQWDRVEVASPLNRNVLVKRSSALDVDRWWWIGIGMTSIGGLAYYCF